MRVKFEGKVYEFAETLRGYDLLRKLNLNPEEHLIIVNGELYTEDRTIRGDVEVVIVKVTSSG